MINLINLLNVLLGNLYSIEKNTVSFKTICLVCAQYKKNGAIQKDLVADNEWSPYKSFL